MNEASVYIEYDPRDDRYLLFTPTTCGRQSMCDEYGHAVNVADVALEAGSSAAGRQAQQRLLDTTAKFRRFFP